MMYANIIRNILSYTNMVIIDKQDKWYNNYFMNLNENDTIQFLFIYNLIFMNNCFE